MFELRWDRSYKSWEGGVEVRMLEMAVEEGG